MAVNRDLNRRETGKRTDRLIPNPGSAASRSKPATGGTQKTRETQPPANSPERAATNEPDRR